MENKPHRLKWNPVLVGLFAEWITSTGWHDHPTKGWVTYEYGDSNIGLTTEQLVIEFENYWIARNDVVDVISDNDMLIDRNFDTKKYSSTVTATIIDFLEKKGVHVPK